jgi:hypothetical protein
VNIKQNVIKLKVCKVLQGSLVILRLRRISKTKEILHFVQNDEDTPTKFTINIQKKSKLAIANKNPKNEV